MKDDSLRASTIAWLVTFDAVGFLGGAVQSTRCCAGGPPINGADPQGSVRKWLPVTEEEGEGPMTRPIVR